MAHIQQKTFQQSLEKEKIQLNQILSQSTESALNIKSINSISKIASYLTKYLKKSLLHQAFQSIHRHSSALKTKHLIYAAIYNKNPRPQKQSLTTRKKKQDTQIQTIKKQKQESFHFNVDDISTIIRDKTQNQTIGKQSRVDLEQLLQIGTNKVPNKFIYGNTSNFNNDQPYFLSAKRSKTDKSFEKEIHNSTFCQNIHFQNFKVKDSSIDRYDQTLEYSQTIKIKRKFSKQTDKSTIHQIFIFRETPKKLTRPLSQDFSERVRFIEIPLKSKNVKIINCNQNSKKQYRSSQSLNSKECLNTRASGSSKHSVKEQCKYCQRIQKSREMLEKWKNDFYQTSN